MDRRQLLVQGCVALASLGLAQRRAWAISQEAKDSNVTEEVQFGDPDLPPQVLRYDDRAIRGSLVRTTKALGIHKNPLIFSAQMLRVATKFVGMTATKNPNPVGEFLSLFGIEPRNSDGSFKPFCAAAVSYCACRAYCDISPKPVKYESNDLPVLRNVLADINNYYFEPHCACQRMVDNARSRGVWQSLKLNTRPESGWLVFFDWNSDGKADHIGIVNRVNNDQLYTIEFNTSSNDVGDQRNSGVIACKSRSFGHVLGFIRTYSPD